MDLEAKLYHSNTQKKNGKSFSNFAKLFLFSLTIIHNKFISFSQVSTAPFKMRCGALLIHGACTDDGTFLGILNRNITYLSEFPHAHVKEDAVTPKTNTDRMFATLACLMITSNRSKQQNTRKSSCMNARGIPSTLHNCPGPNWGRVGQWEGKEGYPCPGWGNGEGRAWGLGPSPPLPLLWTDTHLWKHYLLPSFGCGW